MNSRITYTKLCSVKPRRCLCVRQFGSSTMKCGRHAFHYWIVDDDGNIIDPMFEEYEIMKKLFGLEGPPVYHEWSIKNQLIKIKEQNKKDKKCYRENAQRVGQPIDVIKRRAMEQFRNKPEFGKCNINAMSIKDAHPTYKIKIGNMGWGNKEGRIWWQY
eukprot:SAG22_NODE_7509_length_732_cov_2.515008_1_plen_159_part_00